MSKQHELKISPKSFRAIAKEGKTFEVRKNDRNFQKGDVLTLCEWADGEYTGRIIGAIVSYILKDPNFCKEGYVIMALADILVTN